MEQWIWNWARRKLEAIENDLKGMKGNGKGSEVEVWAWFLEFLKSLDHDHEVVEESNETDETEERWGIVIRIGLFPWIVPKVVAKREFCGDTWPPRWFDNTKSVMRHWEWAKECGVGEVGRTLRAILYVRVTRHWVPSCLADILHDTMKQGYLEDHDILQLCAELMNWLADCYPVKAGDECLGLPVILWELFVSVILFARGGQVFVARKDANDVIYALLIASIQGLYTLIVKWPELAELFEVTEKGRLAVIELQGVLQGGLRIRLAQAYAMSILIRVPYSIGVRLPVDGQTERRMSVLKNMEKWVWEWKRERFDFIERDLEKKRRKGAADVAMWESFLEYLKSPDLVETYKPCFCIS
jgi:hypothetical protein